MPSCHPLPWTSRRAEGSPGPLGRPVLEGPALWFDLLLSLTRAPRKQLWQLARQVAWRTGRCPTFSRSGRTLARAGITPVAETAINFHSLSSCTDCVDKAAGGAFWAPPAEFLESGRQDLPMVSRLGLFASSRRANPSEMPTAGEVTVTDGEHRQEGHRWRQGETPSASGRPDLGVFCKGVTWAFNKTRTGVQGIRLGSLGV